MADHRSRKELVDQALRALAEADDERRSLAEIHRQFAANAERLAKLAAQLSHAIPATRAELADAWKQIQETQMSFNLQYLALQQKMQNENRSYTAVSNIMKTKHDTVKNSICNIR